VLEDFLNAKPLFYDEIDYTRMPRVYERIQKSFKLPKVIHIVGTNGKGTTGRFLATALYKLGFNTAHYTSPHIITFNERIWLNGKNVSMENLEQTHETLLKILTKEEAQSLSYFEYTTLLAMLFFSNRSDFIVLEAGLGGEHDATAVFANDLTLVTPIDRDHEAFLGDDIETIAQTKLNAIQKKVIIAKQKHSSVYDILQTIVNEKKIEAYTLDSLLQQSDYKKIETIAKHECLAPYLIDNLSLAIAALRSFDIAYSCSSFYDAKLFGRLTYLSENIIVDVGHNVLAAQSIVASLPNKHYILIYNSYKDKNYKAILTILKPIIKSVELIDVYNNRIAESSYLQNCLDELGIEWKRFQKIQEEESYLVFGSFSVVEAFLRSYHG